mmetsp:Transcript_16205/g.37976  ORF Transcript_16205/g.37976 Transcript_16205/m.37976 type:complete len:195 (-) Transcript_16205:14-598(-)
MAAVADASIAGESAKAEQAALAPHCEQPTHAGLKAAEAATARANASTSASSSACPGMCSEEVSSSPPLEPADGCTEAGESAAQVSAASTSSSGPSADAKGKEAKKQVTLANALFHKENRKVAVKLFTFAAALAVVPVLGLLCCERFLRSVVENSSTRWTYSAVAAVLLVNLVMCAYVVHCFMEEAPSCEDKKKR